MSARGSYFEFSYHVENLLFKGLGSSTVGGLFGLCIGVAVFTVLYESIKQFHHYLAEKCQENLLLGANVSRCNSQESETNRSDDIPLVQQQLFDILTSERLKCHLFQTVLHTVQVVMGYMIMLVIMSFNVWLGMSVVFASCISYHVCSTYIFNRPVLLPVEAVNYTS
ncbi:probable low affinity copper uptake protein 2 [Limulus polyphemus]|uniref:Copper transport protein n=1 Tax=Limulus polyphemus TaxID=6850 RepID=A0ABM1TL67_LIMPO|nr:probable low affinity copper uptake protein 2 [Limulus polyphemus]